MDAAGGDVDGASGASSRAPELGDAGGTADAATSVRWAAGAKLDMVRYLVVFFVAFESRPEAHARALYSTPL